MLRGAFLLAAVAAALAGTAQAGNQPHPTLDAIASEVAGRPVSVWCETDWDDWHTMTGGRFPGAFVRSLTDTVAYMGPLRCTDLTAAVSGSASVTQLGGGLQALLHEAVHLRGVLDEGETDCTALGLVREYAIRYFGFPETVAEKRRVTRTVRVKRRVWVRRDGRRVRVVRWVRVKRTVTVTVTVPNPALANVYGAASQVHRRSVSADPSYAGFCDR